MGLHFLCSRIVLFILMQNHCLRFRRVIYLHERHARLLVKALEGGMCGLDMDGLGILGCVNLIVVIRVEVCTNVVPELNC